MIETLQEQLNRNKKWMWNKYPSLSDQQTQELAKTETMRQRRDAPGHTAEFRNRVEKLIETLYTD